MQASTLLVCIVLGCEGAFAQIDTGTVGGTVRNPAGEGAAGAKVFLKSEATSITKSTYTRGDGTYIFTPVKIGVYSVSVELQGFVPAFQTGVTVDIQQRAEVNFRLVASQAASGATVSSGSTASYNNEPREKVLSADALNTLPVFSRNYTFLAQLLPGTGPMGPDTTGLAATGSFVANGVQSAQNNYLLDGADNNTRFPDFTPGTAYVVIPPMEGIAEFRVQSPLAEAITGGAAGAAVNVSTKSGGNEFHGSAWGYLSNDATNAADFFDNAVALKRAELRKSQFGASLAGPLDLGNFYNGKNRTFFFADYQGLKYRQGVPFVGTVPTNLERSSGYTNFSDLIAGQPNCTSGPDVLGRVVPCGTIFDPATTRYLAGGQRDPITGLTATVTGYARDPFPGNHIPVNRVDSVAAGLLNLYPAPTIQTIFNNYTTNAYSRGDDSQFDIRVDHHASDRNQVFARFSFYDNPQLQTGPFPAQVGSTPDYADGGGYTQTQTTVSGVLSINHVSSPTLISDLRLAANRMAVQRLQAYGNDLTNIPARYGIEGIPQFTGNGGLPTLNVGIYSQLGSTPYMPAIDYSETYQISEGISKVKGIHNVKGGGEVMYIKAATNQPPYSRGGFDFSGNFTSIPNVLDPSTGTAQFVLTPEKSNISFGRNYVGGASQVLASNISNLNIDNRRLYYAAYLQDTWKYRPNLTISLGGRWEYFQPWKENFSAEANLIPGLNGTTQYLIPSGRGFDTLPCGPLYPISCIQTYFNTLSTSFTDQLIADSVTLTYGRRGSLVDTKMLNIAPRFAFAYQYSPQIVIRGGYAMFYGGLENEGAQANLGGNYPFQVNYDYTSPDDGTPILYGCPPTTLTVSPTSCVPLYATLENGLAPVTLFPYAVTAYDLALRGIQHDFRNPYTENGNLKVEYRRTNNDLVEFSFVSGLGRHLLINPGTNTVWEMLPPFEQRQIYEPYLTFAYDSSYIQTEGKSKYNAGQLQYERNFGHGLNFLANYTYTRTRTDALNYFNLLHPQTYRAPNIESFGVEGDYQQADFNVRSAVHFSGGYELPFGPGKMYLAQKGDIMGKVLGNWTLNWIYTWETGQPVTIPCTIVTASGAGCDAPFVSGANPYAGAHNVNQYWNPEAFYNPQVTTAVGQTNFTPLGGAPGQVIGPGLNRLDAALRRSFQVTENVRVEFRAEAYNVLNHPYFAQPSNLNFLNTTLFGQISSTRDNPNDAREIQFAVKFYF
jgi:hypothetical protein